MVSIHFPTKKEIVDFFVGSLYWIEVTNKTAVILSLFGIVLIIMLFIVLVEVTCSCASIVCPGPVWKLKACCAKGHRQIYRLKHSNRSPIENELVSNDDDEGEPTKLRDGDEEEEEGEGEEGEGEEENVQ